MNSVCFYRSSFARPLGWVVSFIVCLPSLVLAHPGHYHPDETDEFDFFRAMFFHSHGAFDFLLGGVVIVSAAVVFLSKGRHLRLGALGLALGALSWIAIF